MNIFINAVKRAEGEAREMESFGLPVHGTNWVNHLPAHLMRSELIAFVKDSARFSICLKHPEFRNYTQGEAA